MRQTYEKWDGSPKDPYYFDEGANCPTTDIEANMWSDIRYFGLPFYYQFPIGKYYADFADPFHGLVVETDGKIHIGNEARDAERDAYIRSIGFQVIRIPGRDTYDQEEEMENGEIRTIAPGVVRVMEWYTDRSIPVPFSKNWVLGMEWKLFKKWKESLGVVPDKTAFDEKRHKSVELHKLIDKKGVISFAEIAEYI